MRTTVIRRLICAAVMTAMPLAIAALAADQPPTRDRTSKTAGATERERGSRGAGTKVEAARQGAQTPPASGGHRADPDASPEPDANPQAPSPSRAAGQARDIATDDSPSIEVERDNAIAVPVLIALAVSNLLVMGGLVACWDRIRRVERSAAAQARTVEEAFRQQLLAHRQSIIERLQPEFAGVKESIRAVEDRLNRQADAQEARARAATDPALLQPHAFALPRGNVPLPVPLSIDALVEDFCSDRIDHRALVFAAEGGGVRWGTGTPLREQNRISVEFGSLDNRIVVVGTTPGSSEDFHILVREDAHWSLDLAVIFKRASEAERAPGGRDARARSRKPGRGRLDARNELSVDEQGLVELF